MRKIDEQKRQRVEEAVLIITKEEGIQSLSFGKIAKQAHVSSGTPYVYYQDKTAMLSKIYLNCKILFDSGLNEHIARGNTLEERTFQALNHFCEKYLSHPLEGNFINEILANPKLVTAEALERGSALASPLMTLLNEVLASGRLVTTNAEFLTVLLFSPPLKLIANRNAVEQQVTLKELQELIKIAVASVFVK